MASWYERLKALSRTVLGNVHELPRQVSSVLVLVGTCGVLVGSVVMILPIAAVDMAALCCMQHMLPYTSLALAYAALITKALHIRLHQAVDSVKQVTGELLFIKMW